MKYSLPNRIAIKYLRQADEIKIQCADYQKTLDYVEKYPEADIVLCVNDKILADINIDVLKMYAEKANNFTVEIEDFDFVRTLKNNNISFFWKFAATSLEEIKALKKIGVSQVLVDAPAFFQMDDVKKFGLPVRIIPNTCFDSLIPRDNGLHGSWVRPQDQELYEPYVTTIEFKEPDLKKVEALFDIYKKQKVFYSDLNILFKDFRYPTPIMAPGILPDVIKSRLNCKQRCATGKCHICDLGVKLGQKIQEEFSK